MFYLDPPQLFDIGSLSSSSNGYITYDLAATLPPVVSPWTQTSASATVGSVVSGDVDIAVAPVTDSSFSGGASSVGSNNAAIESIQRERMLITTVLSSSDSLPFASIAPRAASSDPVPLSSSPFSSLSRPNTDTTKCDPITSTTTSGSGSARSKGGLYSPERYDTGITSTEAPTVSNMRFMTGGTSTSDGYVFEGIINVLNTLQLYDLGDVDKLVRSQPNILLESENEVQARLNFYNELIVLSNRPPLPSNYSSYTTATTIDNNNRPLSTPVSGVSTTVTSRVTPSSGPMTSDRSRSSRSSSKTGPADTPSFQPSSAVTYAIKNTINNTNSANQSNSTAVEYRKQPSSTTLKTLLQAYPALLAMDSRYTLPYIYTLYIHTLFSHYFFPIYYFLYITHCIFHSQYQLNFYMINLISLFNTIQMFI